MTVVSRAAGAFLVGAALVLAAGPPGAPPARAQDEAEESEPKVGATVFGKGDSEVGKIDFVSPDKVVIDTGTVRGTVERDALRVAPNGWRVNITREELEAAVLKMREEASAGVKGFFKVDAIVRAADGKTVLGTIRDIGEDDFILGTSRFSVVMDSSMLRADDQGLKLTLSAAEFNTATAPKR